MTETPTKYRPPRRLFFKHIIRKIFLEDWATKLVALGITLALWLGVTGLSTPTTTRLAGIPLSLRFSSSTEVTNSPVQEIDVIISGDNRKIAQINKNDLVASVDLTDVLPGERVVQLTPANVRLELPLGVRLDEIQPARMVVRLEAVEEKEVPVQVLTEGKPADGFEIYSQTSNPPRVRIRGPVSLTKQVNEIVTEKVNIAERKADFTARQTPLSAANAKTTMLETVVDVFVKIGEKRVERTFTVPASDGSAKKVLVTLYGGRTVLNELKPEAIDVKVVKNAAGADTAEVTLPSNLQENVEIRKTRIL